MNPLPPVFPVGNPVCKGEPRRKFPRTRGMALVIVLAILVLVTVLAVAFLSSVSTDASSSKSYADGARLVQMAEAAVGVVQAQIRDATAGFQDPSNPTAANQLAWISQPGLLRTFDTSGNPHKAYKLYSSDTLQVAGPFDPAGSLATEVPSNWASKPDEFFDLNAPVTIGGITSYPILDPPANNATDPKGFANNAAAAGVAVSGENPAPMPVRWLYQLKDGQIVSWSELSTKSGVTNPPVGRIAFWADDETCKVNINTAAGDEWNNTTDPGSYWDYPKVNTTFSFSLAKNQPVNGEFQRYPGHPATTYLGAVFPDFSRSDLFNIAPKINGGGSVGGSQNTTFPSLSSGVPAAVTRLYASVDELIFKPDRTPNNLTALKKDRLEKARFFLTAHSRAPDVNLYNRPRVSIWPQNTNETKRTPTDKLLAFCSKIGGKEFFFQRENPSSQTNDFTNIPRNQELYAYLQTLTSTAIPGFGGNFATKYDSGTVGTATATDRDQILTQIFDYVRAVKLTDPNAVFSFTPKDPNAAGSGFLVPIKINNTRGFGRFPTLTEAAILFYQVRQTPDDLILFTPDGTDYACQEMRAILLFERFNPGAGYPAYASNCRLTCTVTSPFLLDYPVDAAGAFISGGGTINLNMGSGSLVMNYPWTKGGAFTAAIGGYEGPNIMFFDSGGVVRKAEGPGSDYPFHSMTQVPMVMMPPGSSQLFKFRGGEIDVKMEYFDTQASSWKTAQTFTFSFPSAPVLAFPPFPLLTQIKTPSGNANLSAERGITFIANRRLGSGTNWKSLILAPDVVRSLQPMGPELADARLFATLSDVPTNYFIGDSQYGLGNIQQAHTLGTTWSQLSHGYQPGNPFPNNPQSFPDIKFAQSDVGKMVPGANYPSITGSNDFISTKWPDLPKDINGVVNAFGMPGDWDADISSGRDGAFINKPDDGSTKYGGTPAVVTKPPYIDVVDSAALPAAFFSPNRIMPSPVQFGSLPTGVWRKKPWQTLLFCPNPASGPGPTHHEGFVNPPDHLLLDLFHMPVVEPYAISEPFSTAGKVNLNTQIAPFTYLKRDTALRSVLRSTRVISIPTSEGPKYRGTLDPVAKAKLLTSTSNYHHNVDLGKTLDQWIDAAGTSGRFAIGINRPFISPSEICDIYLYPDDLSGSITNYWNTANAGLTSDNEREKPYNDIYSRLTTKSNTYTVHLCVQALQPKTGKGAAFNPQADFTISGEWRGANTIERYIDPDDPDLVGKDFAALTLSDPDGNIDKYYKFRVVTVKKFTP